MQILCILYIFSMFGVLFGGVIYCGYTYGRKTKLEKSLQEMINNSIRHRSYFLTHKD